MSLLEQLPFALGDDAAAFLELDLNARLVNHRLELLDRQSVVSVFDTNRDVAFGEEAPFDERVGDVGHASGDLRL